MKELTEVIQEVEILSGVELYNYLRYGHGLRDRFDAGWTLKFTFDSGNDCKTFIFEKVKKQYQPKRGDFVDMWGTDKKKEIEDYPNIQ